MDKKKAFRFNIIDVIVIIALLALAAAFVFRSVLSDNLKITMKSADIQYEFKSTSLQEESGDLLQPGDAIYDDETDKLVGTVQSVSTSPAELYVTLQTGEIVKRTSPGRIDLTVVIEAEGKTDETGVYLNGSMFIAPGKELHLYTKNLDFVGTVQDVSAAVN